MTNTTEPRLEGAPEKRSIARSILAGLPTFLVLACIGGVGLWGHHTGWKAPRFSELFGKSASTEAEDWCTEHNVPDSKCIACHPELAGENPADWCKEHGVPESQCTVCHPEILQTGVAGGWCKEHGVPEADCTICHPEIARKSELTAEEETAVVSTEGSPPTPVRDPRTCQTHATKVQFASPASVAKAGVRLGKVVERPMAASILVNAEVDYDRTHFARVSSRVSGSASRIEKELGSAVRAGETLALIDAAEVGRAKAEFLQAFAAVESTTRALKRVQSSADAGFRTEAERLAAESAAREAEIRLFNAKQALVNLGLSVPDGTPTEASIARLGIAESLASTLSGELSANLIPLVARFDGVVVSRDLVAGDVVDPTKALFEIADTRRMWVTMDLPQAEAGRVALGQQVLFRPDDARDEGVGGTVTWISTSVDEMTRTVKVRADVENPGGTLRAHSFGRAEVVLRTSADAVAVPNEAVQWEGCCYVVFVRLTDEIFQTRKVRLGAKDAAYTEVLVGVLPGEVVATTGSHVLKSEILKSNLGAGCTDD